MKEVSKRKKEISVIGASVVRVRVRYKNDSKNSQTIPRVSLSCLLFFRWSFSLPFKLNCLSENTVILVLRRIFSVFFDFRLQKPPFSKENTTFLVASLP